MVNKIAIISGIIMALSLVLLILSQSWRKLKRFENLFHWLVIIFGLTGLASIIITNVKL